MTDLPKLARPRRRWFRVNLRGLMILVLVVAGLIAWPITIIHRQREAIHAVREARGFIEWDYEIDAISPGGGRPAVKPEPHAPRWVRRLLGDELFQNARRVYLGPLASTDVLSMLPRFGQVQFMNIKGPAGPGPGSNVFHAMPRLEYLEVEGPWVTDAVLADVAEARSLIQLTLVSPAITDAGVERLASLGKMLTLTITLNPTATDAGLARAVAGMPQLYQLDVHGQGQTLHATASSLARHCPVVQTLQTDGTGLVDADLEPIGQLAKLRMLTLNQAPITGAGLVHLGGHKQLAALYLNDTKVAGGDLSNLRGLTGLERLDCTATRVGDAGLPALVALPNLQYLNLIGTCVTDAGLPMLAPCPKLADLALGNNGRITDKGMPVLATFPQLQIVMLDHTRVTDAGAGGLSTLRPKMTIFNTNQGAPPPGSTPWQPEGSQP